MKILHCCLSCFYIDNYNYQENILPRINHEDGNEVLIIASTETFINNKELGYVEPSSYVTEFGVPIIRIPYHRYINTLLTIKVRRYVGLYEMIENFAPDVILFHGMGAYDLLTVSRYVRNHAGVKLYVDSHEDAHNSATNFLSKYVLHKLFYKRIIKKSLHNIDKVLYLAYETRQFLELMYDVPDEKLEYYPLGGIVVDENSRLEKRKKIRESHKLSDNDILLVHSGKMDKLKRTKEIVLALSGVSNQHVKLIIIGSMTDDVKEELMPLINNDSRIDYVGWKNAEQLVEYLCASDLYVQPGGQSATMQMALCCGSAAALYPYKSHKYLLGDSVFYVNDSNDIREVINQILNHPGILEEKRKKSYSIACTKLDYRILAERLYH